MCPLPVSTLKPFGTSFLPFLVGLAFFYLMTCVWWFEEGYPQNLPSGIPSIGSLASAWLTLKALDEID
jgi:hypothetical protein